MAKKNSNTGKNAQQNPFIGAGQQNDELASKVAPAYIEDPRDQLTKKSAQLSALLITITGGGFESFNAYNGTIKDNYLWACADLAKEVSALSDKVTSHQSI